MERQQSYVQSMDEGIRRAQEENYAFIGESVFLDLVVVRYCNIIRCPEIIGMRGYSIAAPVGRWRCWQTCVLDVDGIPYSQEFPLYQHYRLLLQQSLYSN